MLDCGEIEGRVGLVAGQGNAARALHNAVVKMRDKGVVHSYGVHVQTLGAKTQVPAGVKGEHLHKSV